MERIRRTGKVIILDTLGILLIIIAPFFGWIPGPGGIPIFLAGLSLLAVNHAWARRLLINIKREGLKLFDMLFPEHRMVQIAYDISNILLVIAGIYIIREFDGTILTGVAASLLGLSLGIFIGNRERGERFLKLFKQKA